MDEIKAFLFDLDGCLYFGSSPAQGAPELLASLRSKGKRCFFVTNNSTETSQEISNRMNGLGLTTAPEEIITATDCTGGFIMDCFGPSRVKVFGSHALHFSVASSGHHLVGWDDSTPPEVIVIGRDTAFTYDKLRTILTDIREGAITIGTNPDLFHLGKSREIVPETGALTAAVETFLGEKIDYIGKPNPYMFNQVLRRSGLNADECVMVGDNLETDIAGGNRVGMQTVWINDLSAGLPLQSLREDIRPDYVIIDLSQLSKL
jgi:HAD superfamily hydrolase (TIGR01450 family)